ncbi:MAG: hypothetical protein OCD00_00790 [Colwellia sp.]
MIIKKFAFGNKSEAFVEERFEDKLNIIFSNDNNKGKTLVLQGIMFAIGNEAIFPASFEKEQYYFYLDFDYTGKSVQVLRKNDTFSVIVNGEINILESESEFKYFFDKNIYKLPEIVHRGYPKLVDFTLFYQLFFVGQDKRDTSSIFNSGFYNKADFIEMLYAMKGISGIELSTEQVKELKIKLSQLRTSERKLVKEIDKFKINKAILESVKSSSSYKQYKEQEVILKKLNDRVIHLKKQRNRENSRLNSHLGLKSELKSLNRAISIGKVKCDDCGSENISYKSKDITFDVSNKQIRESILLSVGKNIQLKKELVSRLDFDIEKEQMNLDGSLSQVSPELRDIILFQDELKNTGSLNKELRQKQREIEALNLKLEESSTKQEGVTEQQKQLIDVIIKAMNEVYKLVDKNGIQVFNNLFTKKSVNYSGSEGPEFYFAKLFALHIVFKHDFPIIVDSFRDHELSSAKELKMIDIFENMENQVIVSSTLKHEEYTVDKYESYKSLTALDYSSHESGHILSQKFVSEFIKVCGQFGVFVL